jgi:tetratricopeptide (TPR) repeat protein
MEIFRELSGVEEKYTASLMHLGKVLTTVGETGQAIDCFQRVLEDEPLTGQAYWELANLKTYRFPTGQIEAMERLLKEDGLPAMDRILVQFALGRALEDEGRFAESFEHFELANGAYAKFHPPRYVSKNADLKAFFTQDYFAARKDSGSDTKEPIFIVGMPRSGSTLVEQILSAHSEVDATAELTEIISIAREIGAANQPGQGRYPEALADLAARQIQDYAQRYLDFAQPLRRGGDFFTDKTPGNFHHIGLIKTLFPNAKIIDARRNPMASGWSLYKHFFADSFLFSYDLETIGQYYADYLELMDHWHAVLPGQILTLNYEDLVNDLPAAVDRLLRYCSLPYEKACLDFHENRRAVATPSSEQVRSPLYTSALDHWKNYEEFLGPLRQVISEADAARER